MNAADAACCASTRSRRPKNCGHYYPANYWFAPDASAASRMEEAYRRLVLRDHVAVCRARALRDTGARGPLLDAGCGGGLFLGMMRERGFRVLGLDYSRDAAAIAWRRQQAPAVCAALDRRAFRARAALAAITMFHVLEHLYDPRAYLSAAHAIARARRPPDRPGAQRGLLAIPLCWAARGTASTSRAICSIIAVARSGKAARTLPDSTCCAANIFRCATIPPASPAASRRGSTPWRAACAASPRVRGLRPAKDLAYLALTAAALPFTVAEAARARLHRHDRGAPPVKYTGTRLSPPACLCAVTSCTSNAKSRTPYAPSPRRSRPARACSTPGRAKANTRTNSLASATAASISRWAMPAWNYSRLDAVADLTALPFRDATFDAALHIVTIEHLPEPARALAKWRARSRPARLLLIAAPHEWEVHQAPHDYFRYTRYGLAYLLKQAGFERASRSARPAVISGCSRAACSTGYNSSQGAFAGCCFFRPRYSWFRRR